MNRIIKCIPNTITTCNLLSGCIAIIFSFSLFEISSGLEGWKWVMIFIGMAAVFDFCDGLAARTLKAYSDIGKELDSLSDLVSFGVAPAMLMFNLISSLYPASPLRFLALLIPAMGALRLARFNVDDRQTSTFIGLPIPANAIFFIGLAATLISHWSRVSPWLVAIALIIVPILMVSDIPMFSLKFKNLRFQGNFPRYFIIICTIIFEVCMGVSGLLWIIILYVLTSIVACRRPSSPRKG
ncbi:MAG: CDP-diacylglycerol--serine O-phosphatidyltransferase [Muribaculaceae bacterium]|nr:CDP-diacylglycerol--serine O-phosphatidyltransferase [Muribaculaceae bacterium]